MAITSPYENNYVKKIAKNLNTRLWIGLTDSLAEGTWMWVDDTDTNRFSNWAEGEPNGDRRENCGNMDKIGWFDDSCSDKKPFICKMEASTDPSGNPVLPDTSTMPPTNNCGYMANKWVENHDTGMCYSLVKDRAYTWTDAKEYCKEMGGHREYGDLASIGTLEEQTFFNCEKCFFN